MPRKILYVITKANWGGAQKYVYEMAIAAKKEGYDVVVACGGTGPLTERLAAAGVRVAALPLRQRRSVLLDLLTFGSLFPLLALIRRENPHVLHANSAKAGGLGALAGRWARVPRIIFTAHGWEFNAPRSFPSKIAIGLFSWITILLSHTTICVSDALRRNVAWMPFVKKKLTVIHNGLVFSPLLSREEARAKLAPPVVGRYWIGMISELHPTKRIEDALTAFALLSKEHPEAILLVMGGGELRGKLQDLIRDLGLGQRATLLGPIPDAGKYLRAFDLFVHSSRSEGLALAILEAGYASLPVIATRVGGIPEIITDKKDGILVPPYAPEKLAHAMEALMHETRESQHLGEALHARVVKDFSNERMVRETFAQYR